MTVTASPTVEDQFPRPEPSRSPALLRNHQFGSVVAVLVLALLTIGQVLQLRSDLADRPELTTQAVRVTQLQAEVVRAGRLAAVAPLAGGASGALEASLRTATALVVQAAAAGADPDRLAAVNAALGDYGHLLRQAAGAQPAQAAALLASADKVLSDSLQPSLQQLAGGISDQATQASWLAWALGAAGVAVIGILIWGWVRSSRLSHRVVNPGLALAAVLVAGMTVLAVNVATGTGAASSGEAVRQASSLAAIQSGAETSARLQAQAVLAAKFSTSQAAAEQAARQTTSKAIDNTTPTEVRKASSAALDALASSAALLAKSSWTQAGGVLTGTSGSQLPDDLWALATSCTAASDELVTTAAAAPQSQSTTLVVAAVGLGVLAAAAVVAVIWGVGARLKEYQ